MVRAYAKLRREYTYQNDLLLLLKRVHILPTFVTESYSLSTVFYMTPLTPHDYYPHSILS